MFVDYTNLNQACLKYSYPLSNTVKLVDSLAYYNMISFMDAYSNYNQISMFEADRDNRAFMTKWANYWYNFMPFGLKNAREPFHKNDE